MQLVTFRVEATGVVAQGRASGASRSRTGRCRRHRRAPRRSGWPEAGDFVDCPVYARDALRPGNRFAGPAIVEQMDATTLVLPGMTARVDPYLNLILEAA